MARSASSNLRILAIETSCDETALALIEASGGLRAPKFKILKEAVASQIKVHRPFGGVVPTLAKREHLKNLPLLFRQIFGAPPKIKSKAQPKNSPTLRAPRFTLRDADIIAVTVGPGLEPALWAGIEFAKGLRQGCRVPGIKRQASGVRCQVIGVNHLEGHLYSFLLPSKSNRRLKPKSLFPAVALIVSGGHTVLLLLKNLKSWERIGETRDDAVGEAFDKVARMLRLPYPGGPELEKLAAGGNPEAINFPRPMLHNNSPSGKYDFSFSGLKTSVLYYLRDHPLIAKHRKLKADVAASFQKAAIDVLVAKTMRAAKEFNAKLVILSGGVAANGQLRKVMNQESRKMGVRFLVADKKYNTDNAVMIAAAAYMSRLRNKKYPLKANGALNV